MSKYHSTRLNLADYVEASRAYRDATPFTITLAGCAERDIVSLYDDGMQFRVLSVDVVGVDGDTVTLQNLTVEQKDAMGWYGKAGR